MFGPRFVSQNAEAEEQGWVYQKHTMPCHKRFTKKLNGAVVSDFVK